MFNDISSPAALMATRRSGKPRDMGAPGPDATQLDRILAAATRVPDHGKLFPWRFVVVPTDRRAAFAELLHRASASESFAMKVPDREAIDQFAYQAPCLVVALSCPMVPSHITLWEQQLSAGAACMNLLVAAHAEGFVGGWLTTWAAYSRIVLRAFGGDGPEDRIAGFLFIGSPAHLLSERPRPERGAAIGIWEG